MRKVYVDLHNHSCLSPCGEDEMVPALVAGLHKLAGVRMYQPIFYCLV